MTNPKHTDTSRSGDLVERLRQVSSVLFDDYGDGTHAVEDYALPGKAADLIETQAREIERLNEALCFIGKWVERGMFCNSVTASEAISCIAYYPGMPWNSQRWDVDHKPYAAAYYAKFPRTAALAGGPND